MMRILIIGNGISGITAARHLRKHTDFSITVVSEESDYFFSRTALMYVYMGHMRLEDTQPYENWFWAKNRIDLLRTRIERIDFEKREAFMNDGRAIEYDRLILALGSKSNKLDWPGQALDGVHGLYHLQDLEAMERHSARLQQTGQAAVIVGGGLIGVEMAEMFHSRKIPVVFLVREPGFWQNVLPAEEAAMVTRHLREHQIDLRLQTEMDSILPDESGSRCRAVRTRQGYIIPCGFVGLTVGVQPNVDWLRGTAIKINRGILVDEYLQTNLPDVYAIGDCAEILFPAPGRRAIEAVWYTGRMMGRTVAWNIAHPVAPKPYQPGLWFNSAKFFDIEYQVYGDIPAVMPETQATLYWEHGSGKKSIRINYIPAEGKRVVGFNLMGIRYRQELCEKWIKERTPVEQVLAQLGLANFDPEFAPEYEGEIVTLYQAQSGEALRLRQRRGLPGVLKFLNR